MAPGMGLFPCTRQEGVEAHPALGWVGFSLVSEDGGLGRRANWPPSRSWFPGAQVGSVLKESAVVSELDVQRNKYSFLLPPVQILGGAHKFSQT